MHFRYNIGTKKSREHCFAGRFNLIGALFEPGETTGLFHHHANRFLRSRDGIPFTRDATLRRNTEIILFRIKHSHLIARKCLNRTIVICNIDIHGNFMPMHCRCRRHCGRRSVFGHFAISRTLRIRQYGRFRMGNNRPLDVFPDLRRIRIRIVGINRYRNALHLNLFAIDIIAIDIQVCDIFTGLVEAHTHRTQAIPFQDGAVRHSPNERGNHFIKDATRATHKFPRSRFSLLKDNPLRNAGSVQKILRGLKTSSVEYFGERPAPPKQRFRRIACTGNGLGIGSARQSTNKKSKSSQNGNRIFKESLHKHKYNFFLVEHKLSRFLNLNPCEYFFNSP